ncbi:ATP-binding protein [Bdellovibrio sp.]|uniref:ATP-binding protein n=1 Tax=Bdellovibrio sp. TaxID=28201 RepID=UPI0039E2CB03
MRQLTPYIKKDLQKKMVFLGGPRQCGKTTLAKSLLVNSFNGVYLNWDRLSDRKKILTGQWTDQEELLVFDEVHKHKKWKNLVKGFYDTEKEIHRFLITGSARLETYQRGGDSLLGRYHSWRLHPFSLYDLPQGVSRQESLSRLLRVGGFPEVFLDNDEREARRWREERSRRIVREDIRDLEQLQNIDLLELMLDHLRDRVGSTLSISSIAQEVGISPITAKKWINILEKMYLIFTVKGYDKKLTRAVHKPIKVYFYDNAEVRGDESVRFENFVATHLLQRNHFMEDYHGYRMGLFYVKDKNQREVDFLITQENAPQELIEVKLKDETPAKNLISFAEILKTKQATQIVLHSPKSWSKGKFKLTTPLDYFTTLK